MRDLTESHAAYGRAMLADLTRSDAGPGKPVDGVSGGSASDVPAGDGTGPVRPGQPGYMESIATANVAVVYDAALAIVRAAPPMPTPWASSIGVEPDCEYRLRIVEECETYDFTRDRAECASFLAASGRDLDRYGERAGVQRRIIP